MIDAAAWGAGPVAVGAGIVAGLNPCCLPMYPAAVGACASLRDRTLRGNMLVAVAFVLGGALATSVMGVAAGLAGYALSPIGSLAGYAVAAVPIMAGLHTLRVITLPLQSRPTSGPPVLRRLGALGAGASIALIVTPCSTPVLGSVLAAASSTASAAWGGLLLFGYGVGLGLPVIFVGTAAAALTERIASSRTSVDRVGGVLQLLVGLYLVWIA